MDKTIKIDFLEIMKRIFGFNQNNNNIAEVEKEADKIRTISNGISWEEFDQSESSKKEPEKINKKTRSLKKKEVEFDNIQVEVKPRARGGREIE